MQDVDAKLAEDAEYAKTKQAVRSAASSLQAKTREALEKVGETDTGQKVGDATRKVGATIAGLPVVSAVGETLAEHAGIPALMDARETNPNDPWPLLWLSEALRRYKKNRNALLVARAPFEPLSAMLALSVRTWGSLGSDDPVVRCQRAAWSLALQRLNATPSSRSDAHVLARVYLVRGFTKQSMALAVSTVRLPARWRPSRLRRFAT